MIWLDEGGEPACLQDRCCHRTAKLSKGWCENGHIVCGYHGWTYDRDGTLVKIPQFSPDQIVPRLGVRPYHCAERYGYAWVCLDEPLMPIPTCRKRTIRPSAASSSSTTTGRPRRSA